MKRKMENKKQPKSKLYIFSSLFLLATVILCFYVAIQVFLNGFATIGGYSVFRVVTGSMEPTIPTGAILLNQKTDIAQIQENDIICFRARINEIRGEVITHRVTQVLQDETGRIYLETRGDANLSTDQYYADEDNLIGRVRWYSGKENVLTKMLSFLSGKIGFLACIAIPLLTVSGFIFQGAVQNIKKDMYILQRELQKESLPDDGPVEAVNTPLEGYDTLTQEDYDAIYQTLKKELVEEVYGLEGKESTTE